MEIELWAIEGAVAFVDLIRIAELSDGATQGIRCAFPVRKLAHMVLRHGG